MYKENLTLNNLQWLICHKTQQNNTEYYQEVPNLLLEYHIIIKSLNDTGDRDFLSP